MIRLIAAIDARRGIAKHGFQPWHLPADEAYFQQKTVQHGAVVLMGHTTYRVIGGPLPDRQNYVLSRSTRQLDGVTPISDLTGFLEAHPEVWIIGGASVYAQTIDHADELYLSEIAADFGCDQFFPAYDLSRFTAIYSSAPQHQNGFTFTYTVYARQQEASGASC